MAPTRVRPSASPSQVSAPPSKRPRIPLAILDPRSVSVASYVLTHVVHTLFSQPTTPLPHLESSVAFTHASLWKSRKRSFEEEEVEGIKDNERLELLGNGILQYIITQLIVSRAPGLTPGGINIITQALVSNALLCHVSTSLGLPLLLLADPHESATLCSNPEVQADMFEAFIGGLHVERGIEFVKPWVNDLFSSLVDEAVLRAREWYGALEAQGMEKEGDWIGEVMKWVGSSKELKRKVEWMMGEPMGPQNTPLYECACVVSQGTRGDGFHGKGMGPSKKVAKRNAARNVVEEYINIATSSPSLTPSTTAPISISLPSLSPSLVDGLPPIPSLNHQTTRGSLPSPSPLSKPSLPAPASPH